MITIRTFEVSDIPAALELERANQPQPWSERIFRDEVRARDRAYLIAESGSMVGYGGVMVVGDEAHLNNLLVAPEWRGRGVGRRLMSSLVLEGIGRGARHLTLEVRSDNLEAIRLYEHFGLAPVGVRPGYYRDADALIMWAHDIDSLDYQERFA